MRRNGIPQQLALHLPILLWSRSGCAEQGHHRAEAPRPRSPPPSVLKLISGALSLASSTLTYHLAVRRRRWGPGPWLARTLGTPGSLRSPARRSPPAGRCEGRVEQLACPGRNVAAEGVHDLSILALIWVCGVKLDPRAYQAASSLAGTQCRRVGRRRAHCRWVQHSDGEWGPCRCSLLGEQAPSPAAASSSFSASPSSPVHRGQHVAVHRLLLSVQRLLQHQLGESVAIPLGLHVRRVAVRG